MILQTCQLIQSMKEVHGTKAMCETLVRSGKVLEKTGMLESQRFPIVDEIPASSRTPSNSKASVQVRGGGGGKARTGEQGGQGVATHPPSRFVTLHSPRSPRPMLAMEGGACALSRVSEHVRVAPSPLRRVEGLL